MSCKEFCPSILPVNFGHFGQYDVHLCPIWQFKFDFDFDLLGNLLVEPVASQMVMKNVFEYFSNVNKSTHLTCHNAVTFLCRFHLSAPKK